ncbi:MAG: HEPN domain-containing protein [Cyanobacteria bacterium P01_G01_bin.54]
MPQSASSSPILERYEQLFESLREIIVASERRVIDDPPDRLFLDNVNFFVKSYLISICSYLEAYLQDIAFKYADRITQRVVAAKIPNNYAYWRIIGDVKKKDLKFNDVDLSVTKQDISDNISASLYRTIDLFRLLGIDLTQVEVFQRNKGLINAVVVKRNNIIHHNDNANDISFGDLLQYIKVILDYMKAVDEVTNLV